MGAATSTVQRRVMGSLRAAKGCGFALFMVLEVMVLELDAFGLRQIFQRPGGKCEGFSGSPESTPSTDGVELKEPRAAQREPTGSP